MITKEERMVFVKALSLVIKEYVTACMKAVFSRMDALEAMLANLPKPEKGEKGDLGAPGRDGLDGKDGIQGPPGKDAVVDVQDIVAEVVKLVPIPKDGRDGKDGIQGPPGPPGESIRGEQGIPGKDGRDGIDGKDGESIVGPAGPQGERGEKGESITGPPGPQGEKGETGIPGPQGPQGIQGKDGRDALQIDILPSVDLSRSYPRGTFALYDGGIIHSFRNTLPGEPLEKSGWEVILPVQRIVVSQGEDPRSFTVRTYTTGGDFTDAKFFIPAMIYQGIWHAGAYGRGDVVTYAGSAWHCQVDDAKDQPGTSDQWKLMVKEGRRGKDGPEGKQGPQGLPGRNGKDIIGNG